MAQNLHMQCQHWRACMEVMSLPEGSNSSHPGRGKQHYYRSLPHPLQANQQNTAADLHCTTKLQSNICFVGLRKPKFAV